MEKGYKKGQNRNGIFAPKKCELVSNIQILIYRMSDTDKPDTNTRIKVPRFHGRRAEDYNL